MFIKEVIGGSKNKPHRYLQIAHSVRIGKKVKHRTICTLGRKDKLIDKGYIDTLIKNLTKLSKALKTIDTSKECIKDGKIYGPLLLLDKMWEYLDMDRVFEEITNKLNIEYNFSICLKLMIYNRLLEPKSKLGTDSWKEKVYGDEFKDTELHHLYRTLDVLIKNKEKIEDALFSKNLDLFNSCIDIVFYDLTTIPFESVTESDLKRFGYSKENKTDRVQVVLGLLMSKDGMPLGYEIFPGNKFEGKTVIEALEKLKKRFKIDKLIFVGDKGLLSKHNLEEIEKRGYDFIISYKLKSLPEEYKEKILDIASYTRVDDKISTKEFIVNGCKL